MRINGFDITIAARQVRGFLLGLLVGGLIGGAAGFVFWQSPARVLNASLVGALFAAIGAFSLTAPQDETQAVIDLERAVVLSIARRVVGALIGGVTGLVAGLLTALVAVFVAPSQPFPVWLIVGACAGAVLGAVFVKSRTSITTGS